MAEMGNFTIIGSTLPSASSERGLTTFALFHPNSVALCLQVDWSQAHIAASSIYLRFDIWNEVYLVYEDKTVDFRVCRGFAGNAEACHDIA